MLSLCTLPQSPVNLREQAGEMKVIRPEIPWVFGAPSGSAPIWDREQGEITLGVNLWKEICAQIELCRCPKVGNQ